MNLLQTSATTAAAAANGYKLLQLVHGSLVNANTTGNNHICAALPMEDKAPVTTVAILAVS